MQFPSTPRVPVRLHRQKAIAYKIAHDPFVPTLSLEQLQV